jgi:spermidine synthase
MEAVALTLLMEFEKCAGERQQYEVRRVLLSKQTRFQKLDVVDTVTYGRALFLDDKIQSAELDEFIYHESLVHPALVLHPQPRSVLIVGAGEGATLREVLRHTSVKRALMVDIDEAAVAACREYLTAWHRGAFDDQRVELRFEDARAYLEQHDERFDCIVVDVTDPLAGGPSYRIFTREFYQLASDRLTDHGTLSVQAESVDLQSAAAHAAIVATLRNVFPHAAAYQAHVPSFGESWGFAVAAKSRDPKLLRPHEVDATLAERGINDLRFYDGETHTRIFALPRYTRQQINAQTQIVTDDQPIFVT